MTPTPESVLKKELKEVLKRYGAFHCMIKGGPHSKVGDPDIVVCYKGRFIGIEAKTHEGHQSTWQELRERQITEAGGIYAVIRSTEELIRLLEEVE